MAHYKKILTTSVLLTISAFSSSNYASGFAIIEHSVTGLGHAFAGSAAVAEDASTIFFNPAGLTYLSHSELDAGLNLISPHSDFNNKGSNIGGTALTGREGDAGNLAVVPNFYLAHRLSNDTVVGIGINAPFGLVTEYSDNWVGRYHSLKSDLLTININPSIGFKATEKLSLGFGINLQYIDLELTNAVDFGAVCALAAAGCGTAQSNDGKAKLTADDWSWGYNLGLIFQATEATRLALAYRSKISHTLTGKGKFEIPSNVPDAVVTATGFTNGKISGGLDLPESASVAIHHQLNNQWAIMADTTWTRWSRFQELTIESPDSVRLNSTKEEKWRNSLRYGLGLSYLYNQKWTFRSGIAYDRTPISDKYRTARIPGDDRKWITFGASYKYTDNIVIDAAYAHLFVTDPKINEADSQGHILSGDYDASVDILSVQMRWLFI